MTKEVEVESQAIESNLADLYGIADLRDTLSAVQSDLDSMYNIIWQSGNHLYFVIVEQSRRIARFTKFGGGGVCGAEVFPEFQ